MIEYPQDLLFHLRDRERDMPVSWTMSGSSPSERVEPITLDLVKKQLRWQTTSEDDLLASWIAAARTYFEEQTHRQCVNATWEYALDEAPCGRELELPRPPLYSVASITYDDTDGNPQTFDSSNYTVQTSFVAPGVDADPVIDPYCAPGSIRLVSGASWPGVKCQPRSFRVQRVCGYGTTAAAMPPLLQAALYMLVAHFHRNRAEVYEPTSRAGMQVLPLGATAMIDAFKWSAAPRRRHHHHGVLFGVPRW